MPDSAPIDNPDTVTVRPASTPALGGLRDAIRTFVAFIVAFIFTKIFGDVSSIDLAGTQEAIVVIVTSGILAFIGKAMRNHDMTLGKIV